MALQFPLLYIQTPTDIPTYIVVILSLAPIVLGLGWFIYKTRHAKTWRKGAFPQKLKFNQDNLLEAYLALGARLVIFDYESSKDKTQFINGYFNRYFPLETYNFGDSLLFSMRHPIKIQTVNKWLNIHLTSDEERSQVIYFLTGVVMINGTISKRELAFLTLMNVQLQLSEGQLRQTIAIYLSYHESHKKRPENASKEQKKAPNNSTSIHHAKEVLGLTGQVNLKDLKSTYRSLVKRFHPDVFVGATEIQKKIAEEKFIQIQKAYETLLNTMK